MNAVEAKELSKAFGTRKALDRVSFVLPEGAFLSIFGPNGAGKTTLLRLLSTLVRPTDGAAHICGIDLKEEPDKARGLIGMISHAPMLYPDLTAEENLMFYAELYGVGNPRARAVELLEAVGLSHRRLDPVLSNITMNTRSKDVMLAVLFIPLIYPLLSACVTATTAAISGTELWTDLFVMPLVLACGYDVVMLLACWILYDFVVSA